MSNKSSPPWWAIFFFLVAFLVGPFYQSDFLSMMPGDIGDPRLNNYFLENIYRFFAGRSDSLWHLGFFSPYPYVLGFSDNLFGSSPVYLLARVLTGQSDTAFQLWYLFGFVVNYFAAYYAFRKLANSQIAASVGALIFAFTLPVSAYSVHAQLHYRFGVPLSLAMFILFLEKTDWRCFVASAFWLVWQFYCTIYIGFFTLLMLAAIFILYFSRLAFRKQELSKRLSEFSRNWKCRPPREKFLLLLALFLMSSLFLLLFYSYWKVRNFYTPLIWVAIIMTYGARLAFHQRRLFDRVSEFLRHWVCQPPRVRFNLIFSLALLSSLFILLFYPYLKVTQLYDAQRSVVMILTKLPRARSYMTNFGSWFWPSSLQTLAGIPSRWEHQMFIGAFPLLLAATGILLGNRKKNGIAFPLLSSSLAGLIVLTLNIGGFSLWYFFAGLPLFSAIRGVTRIVLVLLFPVAYLAAIAVDDLRTRAPRRSKVILAVVISAMIIEFSATSPTLSAKSEWRGRLAPYEAAFPQQLPPAPIVFFAQANGRYYNSELDAMWVALNHEVKTLNGYSGLSPQGFAGEYGNNCSELPRRVLMYLAFIGHDNDHAEYSKLMRRIVPIGFANCDERWITDPPLATRMGKLPGRYRVQKKRPTIYTIRP